MKGGKVEKSVVEMMVVKRVALSLKTLAKQQITTRLSKAATVRLRQAIQATDAMPSNSFISHPLLYRQWCSSV